MRLVAANEVMTMAMGRTEEEMRGLTLSEIEPNWPFDEMILPPAGGAAHRSDELS